MYTPPRPWLSTHKTFYLLACFVFLSGCNLRRKTLRIATGDIGSPHLRVSLHLKRLLETHLPVRVELLRGQGSRHNLRKLMDQKADLTLVQNDAEVEDLKEQSHIKTVSVLYPQILYIVYRGDIQASSLRTLLAGRKVFVGPKESGTSQLVQRLFHTMGIPPKSYKIIHGPYHLATLRGKAEIVCRLTSANSHSVRRMLTREGGKIWSLDDINLPAGSTAVDGFCLNHPLARPFIIPRMLYDEHPPRPVLSLAVENVLLSSDRLDRYLVYDIVKLLAQQREWLAQQDPLFRGLSFNFRKHALHFPPHAGTQMFLDRDKPSFFVRYAEAIALFITLITLFFGGLSRVTRWRKQRNKDEVDRYYAAILALERKLPHIQSLQEIDDLLDQLFAIRDDAFSLLIEEKLQGNEHFRILLQLIELSYQRLQKERRRRS